VVEVDAFGKAEKPLLKKAVRQRERAADRTAFFSKDGRMEGLAADAWAGKKSPPSSLWPHHSGSGQSNER
jgi:hypothetical protein